MAFMFLFVFIILKRLKQSWIDAQHNSTTQYVTYLKQSKIIFKKGRKIFLLIDI